MAYSYGSSTSLHVAPSENQIRTRFAHTAQHLAAHTGPSLCPPASSICMPAASVQTYPISDPSSKYSNFDPQNQLHSEHAKMQKSAVVSWNSCTRQQNPSYFRFSPLQAASFPCLSGRSPHVHGHSRSYRGSSPLQAAPFPSPTGRSPNSLPQCETPVPGSSPLQGATFPGLSTGDYSQAPKHMASLQDRVPPVHCNTAHNPVTANTFQQRQTHNAPPLLPPASLNKTPVNSVGISRVPGFSQNSKNVFQNFHLSQEMCIPSSSSNRSNCLTENQPLFQTSQMKMVGTVGHPAKDASVPHTSHLGYSNQVYNDHWNWQNSAQSYYQSSNVAPVGLGANNVGQMCLPSSQWNNDASCTGGNIGKNEYHPNAFHSGFTSRSINPQSVKGTSTSRHVSCSTGEQQSVNSGGMPYVNKLARVPESSGAKQQTPLLFSILSRSNSSDMKVHPNSNYRGFSAKEGEKVSQTLSSVPSSISSAIQLDTLPPPYANVTLSSVASSSSCMTSQVRIQADSVRNKSMGSLPKKPQNYPKIKPVCATDQAKHVSGNIPTSQPCSSQSVVIYSNSCLQKEAASLQSGHTPERQPSLRTVSEANRKRTLSDESSFMGIANTNKQQKSSISTASVNDTKPLSEIDDKNMPLKYDSQLSTRKDLFMPTLSRSVGEASIQRSFSQVKHSAVSPANFRPCSAGNDGMQSFDVHFIPQNLELNLDVGSPFGQESLTLMSPNTRHCSMWRSLEYETNLLYYSHAAVSQNNSFSLI